MRTIFAAIAFAASSTAALAENTYASDGVITAQSSAVVTLLSEGHMLMSLPSTHNAFAMSVAGHPFSEMTGTCNGTAEVIGAAVNGGGHCLYENTSGEMLVVRWTAKHIDGNGAFHGDWVVTGGTGSLSGATGGGGFVSLTDDTGAQEVNMTGALSL